MKRSWIDGLTVLGGEPLADWNLDATRELTKLAWKYGKNTWVYTGYYYEQLSPLQKWALDFTDVLVDGPFVEELKDLSLIFKGSSNQRIIKMKDLKINK